MRKAIIVMLAILLVGIVYGATAPMLPSFFYGDATVNGNLVPKGSIIKAYINGSVVSSIEVTENGKYGDENSDNKLAVPGSLKDIVSFSLAMPGYNEIYTNQTALWQSGTMIEIDLDFVGEEVRVAPPSTGGGSSGGGSGGGSGGAIIPQTNYKEFYFAELFEGKQVDVKVDGLPVNEIRIIPSKDQQGVTLKVKLIDDIPYPMEMPVYDYISIDGIEDIQEAIVFFRIPNDWVEKAEGEIALYHFDGDWEKLETVVHGSGSDAEYHYYRAKTFSFSDFAIAAEMVAAEPQDSQSEETEIIDTTTEVNSEGTDDLDVLGKSPQKKGFDTNTKVEDETNPIVGVGIFIGLIIIGLLVYFIIKRGDKR